MKGAPERILERCTTIIVKDRNVSISGYKKSIEKSMLTMGYMGERVLGFADLELDRKVYYDNYPFDPNKANFPLDGLRFAGLMSMIDPPKEGVLDAIQRCRTAGIKVVMLTGDHPVTAMAIAKKVSTTFITSNINFDVSFLGRHHLTR